MMKKRTTKTTVALSRSGFLQVWNVRVCVHLEKPAKQRHPAHDALCHLETGLTLSLIVHSQQRVAGLDLQVLLA